MDAEVLASWSCSIDDDEKVVWGKFQVLTGQAALRAKAAVKSDCAHPRPMHEGTREIIRRLETAAPETVAALRNHISSLPPKPPSADPDQDVFSSGMEFEHAYDPALLPLSFVVTLEPVSLRENDGQLPLVAEFYARLEGVLQTDGSVAWGKFTLLRGEAARKERHRASITRQHEHEGWPSFRGP